LPVYPKNIVQFIKIKSRKGNRRISGIFIVGDDMEMKSNIGKAIDESPYKREYIRKTFNKSRNTISNWCTGKSYPSVPELFKLATLLDKKIEDLYEWKDDV
jgi:DNA-binding XRE family transcriptional regulator